MILQYKGFNHNWCYTEAETISWTNVSLAGITDEYAGTESIRPSELDKLYRKVEDHIQKETNCYVNFVHAFSKPITELTYVSVVMLDTKEYNKTYLFSGETAYILNNSGRTVQRIA